MVMDKGLSVQEVENFLSVAHPHVDIVKLGFGTSFVTRPNGYGEFGTRCSSRPTRRSQRRSGAWNHAEFRRQGRAETDCFG